MPSTQHQFAARVSRGRRTSAYQETSGRRCGRPRRNRGGHRLRQPARRRRPVRQRRRCRRPGRNLHADPDVGTVDRRRQERLGVRGQARLQGGPPVRQRRHPHAGVADREHAHQGREGPDHRGHRRHHPDGCPGQGEGTERQGHRLRPPDQRHAERRLLHHLRQLHGGRPAGHVPADRAGPRGRQRQEGGRQGPVQRGALRRQPG